MRWLRRANLAFAVFALAAPMAHVLELPNKLALDGPLWLAVQQHLYRGWGPFIGAPAEIGALATSLSCLALTRKGARARAMLACLCYAGMLIAFFALNAPVNAAVAGWTQATLPPNWPEYRLTWEAGHALAAALAAVALVCLLRERSA